MKYYEKSGDLLNQEILRKVEALCVQDELPACAAACPLHLDARAMIGHIRKGEWKEAYQLYAKAIPFPRIVSLSCTAPCQDVCKRGECGGTIEIQKLEHYLTSLMAQEAKAPLFIPKKGKKIAIAGGSLRGMTAANDLARKGYQVTLYEKTDKLGGHLMSGGKLTEAAIEADFDSVRKLPVDFRFGETVSASDPESIAEFLDNRGFDALYIACDSPLESDGATLETGITNVVAGRRSGRRHEGYSSIYEILDGKAAATTIDRLMQGVSTRAGREKEGSFDTALYTNLEGVEYAAASEIENDYDEAAALSEAGRCLDCQCLECVKNCSFLRRYKSYPGRYVREVYNNLSIPLGTRHANKMINTCALCGRCEAVCPNGLDMKSVFLAARQLMVQTEKMPPSAHEFALLDMDYSMSDSFFLSRADGGQCEYLFFPGCQLPASEPELVRRVYEDLRSRVGGVGLMLSCCGVMAYWAGDLERYNAAAQQIAAEWENLGRPTIIAACPTCQSALRDIAGLPVTGIWDVLREKGLPVLPEELGVKELSLHHACGARHDKNVKAAIRAIAEDLGCTLSEADGDDDKTPCCGYGGLVPFADADVADEMTAEALGGLNAEHPVLTYCVNCRDRFLAKGTESYHLLELCYGGAANRRQPTWSERQENRAELKRSLLREIWGEAVEQTEGLELVITDGVAEKMEKLKILRSDIAAAIENAEATRSKFVAKNGRFITSHRPRNVTFWVEYDKQEDRYIVYNAYMHRMAAEVTHKRREEAP